MPFDVTAVRAQFPALDLKDGARRRIYLDGPAGTQVPHSVVSAVSDCFVAANANLGGTFTTSQNAAAVVARCRASMADMLGAKTPESIIFGANMTALTKQLSYTIGAHLKRGDSIVLSRMDHDANISPWLDMAQREDLQVHWLELDVDTYQLKLDALESHLKAGAKFIAAGYASNVLGTVNDVSTICAMANQYGAITYIDAVHYAPHGLIDVGALGCAMLVCSAYKFYGPHCAAVYIEPELLDRLNGWPLRPAPQHGAAKFESGTMNHECIAGTHAALDYLKGLGAEGSTPRAQLANAFEHITAHEQALVWQLIGGLQSIGDFKIHGITDPSSEYQRTPTVSITHDTFSPQAILNALTRANIFCWAGHSYAIEPLGQLGLLESGGVLRLGIAHYNTQQEINQVLNVLSEICNEID